MLRSVAPYLAYGFVSLVGATSRVRTIGCEHLEAVLKGGRGFIYAFWHDRQVLFTYTHRDVDAHVLVSRSRDGEIIARTMELSRIGAVRGSSSRGAAAATKRLLELLAAGRPVGITPDGPKGPARRVKDGVLYLAQASGAPILPIANAVSRKLVLERSWDKFQVPLPFSRACVVYGRPMTLGRGDSFETKAVELAEELDRITREADAAIA